MKRNNGWLPKDPNQREEFSTKLSLIGIFWAIFVAVVSRRRNPQQQASGAPLNIMDLVLLGFSTYRLGRLVAFDKVAEPVRWPFTQTVNDESGAGETVEARGVGTQKALGELISCPICAGTWIASGLVYGLHLLPGPTRIFIRIMGAVGFAELMNALTEALSWTGQAARKFAGTNRRYIRPRLAMSNGVRRKEKSV